MAVWVSVNSKYPRNMNKNDSFVLHETNVVLWLKFATLIYPDLTHRYLGIFTEIYDNQPEHRNSSQPETEAWKVKQCGSVKCQKPNAIHMSLCKIMSTDESQQKISNNQELKKNNFNICTA